MINSSSLQLYFALFLPFIPNLEPSHVASMLDVVLSYKVVLTFESVDEILKCDHSNESY